MQYAVYFAPIAIGALVAFAVYYRRYKIECRRLLLEEPNYVTYTYYAIPPDYDPEKDDYHNYTRFNCMREVLGPKEDEEFPAGSVVCWERR